MDFLVFPGWDDVYSRYWWQSVALFNIIIIIIIIIINFLF